MQDNPLYKIFSCVAIDRETIMEVLGDRFEIEDTEFLKKVVNKLTDANMQRIADNISCLISDNASIGDFIYESLDDDDMIPDEIKNYEEAHP